MSLGNERERVRALLGRVGVWTFALDALPAAGVREAVEDIEAIGFPALWVPEGMRSREVFANVSLLLSSSRRLAVASGIANIGARHPFTMELGRRAVSDSFPGRFVLGMGVGHEYQYEVRGIDYSRPWTRMRDYLDRMDATRSSSPEPGMPAPRMLAALGDRMLGLAAERTAGAHSYFVPVEHTERARKALGPEPVLAVEQTVVLETEPTRARAVGRWFAEDYLQSPNYANNLRRLGYSERDVAGAGSDRVIDATIAWGDVEAIAGRVGAHLDAGADHVCLQVVVDDEADACLPQLRELAPAVLSL
jgi:probable F420-dependent oxidoreductase